MKPLEATLFPFIVKHIKTDSIMHEWHSETSTNIYSLVKHFIGFEYNSDGGRRCEVESVRFLSTVFDDINRALTEVTNKSYYADSAYIAPVTTGKLTKAYQNAFASFLEKYKEFTAFDDNLTIAFGRTSSKVTCPHCGSSISLKFGGHHRDCPVCGSSKIISDSNWKTLETKRKLVEKASATLATEAEKCGVTFIGGYEWHC